MINDGTVEKYVTEGVEKAIKESIELSLKSYGTFGKTVKKKIDESMQIAGDKITIPDYNNFIAQVIESQFINVLQENAIEQLKDLVGDIIKPVTKNAKISDILKSIEKDWGDLAREQGNEEIKISVDENSENSAIYITVEHPKYDFEHVKFTLYNHHSDEDWFIGYINTMEKTASGRFINKSSIYFNEVSAMLYKYYAMGTVFELDAEIESIYV